MTSSSSSSKNPGAASFLISAVSDPRRFRKLVRLLKNDRQFRSRVLFATAAVAAFTWLLLSFVFHSLISNFVWTRQHVGGGAGGGGDWFDEMMSSSDGEQGKYYGAAGYPGRQRDEYERLHPPDDTERVHRTVQSLRQKEPSVPAADIPYDVNNCPEQPPADYPAAWNLVNKILKDWPVDSTAIPAVIHRGLCTFDWETERHKAEVYREQEVPFIVKNHPELLMAAERWNSEGYLQHLITGKQRNEHSTNNHFMYWKNKPLKNGRKQSRAVPAGWAPPTDEVQLTFSEWQNHARDLETLSDEEQVSAEHWYFRLNGDWKLKNEYLYSELPIFEPVASTMFMVDPSDQRGINCRFGMKGNIAELHYDSSRNWIVLLGGLRRYILGHPDQCRYMELYPLRHPSGRHSSVNWSHPPTTGTPISDARMNEVVLQAGDALYLPTHWLHFIVSLNENYQCNARSGITENYREHIGQCGFV